MAPSDLLYTSLETTWKFHCPSSYRSLRLGQLVSGLMSFPCASPRCLNWVPGRPAWSRRAQHVLAAPRTRAGQRRGGEARNPLPQRCAGLRYQYPRLIRRSRALQRLKCLLPTHLEKKDKPKGTSGTESRAVWQVSKGQGHRQVGRLHGPRLGTHGLLLNLPGQEPRWERKWLCVRKGRGPGWNRLFTRMQGTPAPHLPRDPQSALRSFPCLRTEH